MNKTMIISVGQSFLDKVVQHTGNINDAFTIALLNNCSITDSFPAGTQLTVTDKVSKIIINPATDVASSSITDIGGIEYWYTEGYEIQ